LDLADALIGDRDDPLVGFLAVREEFGFGAQWNGRHLSRDRRFGCRQPIVTPCTQNVLATSPADCPSLSKRSAIGSIEIVASRLSLTAITFRPGEA
jgi:hypothetical protein